jgi:hypothetical protein
MEYLERAKKQNGSTNEAQDLISIPVVSLSVKYAQFVYLT